MVFSNCTEVVEIWLPVADTSRVEAACSATVASSWRALAEISVAEVVTCIPERCTCPMSDSSVSVIVWNDSSSSWLSSLKSKRP